MQQRLQPDRRRFPRGGRRAGDERGLSPLVMVLEPDPARRAVTEAVLAKGNFAVAPVLSVEGAIAVCQGLMPAVIVCADDDVDPLRAGLAPFVVPVVPTTPDARESDDLIERIRRAVRGGSARTEPAGA